MFLHVSFLQANRKGINFTIFQCNSALFQIAIYASLSRKAFMMRSSEKIMNPLSLVFTGPEGCSTCFCQESILDQFSCCRIKFIHICIHYMAVFIHIAARYGIPVCIHHRSIGNMYIVNQCSG